MCRKSLVYNAVSIPIQRNTHQSRLGNLHLAEGALGQDVCFFGGRVFDRWRDP